MMMMVVVVVVVMLMITGGFRGEDDDGCDHNGGGGDGDDENEWNNSLKRQIRNWRKAYDCRQVLGFLLKDHRRLACRGKSVRSTQLSNKLQILLSLKSSGNSLTERRVAFVQYVTPRLYSEDLRLLSRFGHPYWQVSFSSPQSHHSFTDISFVSHPFTIWYLCSILCRMIELSKALLNNHK